MPRFVTDWQPEALAIKDLEIAQAEEFYRPRALEAAQRLVEHFQPNTVLRPG